MAVISTTLSFPPPCCPQLITDIALSHRLREETLAIAEQKGIRTVWMQIGVRDDRAAALAEQAGLRVVMNRCPKIEYARLHSELGWGGLVSNLISSRRRRL